MKKLLLTVFILLPIMVLSAFFNLFSGLDELDDLVQKNREEN